MLRQIIRRVVLDSRFLIFYLISWFIFGLYVFLSGFLCTNSAINVKSLSVNDLRRSCVLITNDSAPCDTILKNFRFQSRYDRLVIMVIDALRADFVPSVHSGEQQRENMPFLKSLIDKKLALAMQSIAHAPTVTMPRIKSLMSGGVSNVLDGILNLNADKIDVDNFLYQARKSNLTAVFYGDDTWLRLFPSYFLRSEGTHSFFVNDFTEVDNNVTRQLKSELSCHDWNIMILHYLGVDHIGHSHGSQSEHLPRKLTEMDSIIKSITEELESKNTSSLLVICGDHGMTQDGNHGGSSIEETSTPLIFIRPGLQKPFLNSINSSVFQSDFTPTISLLMGTSIPSNSLGQIIPEAFLYSEYRNFEILRFAFYNLLQLLNVYQATYKENTGEHFLIDSKKLLLTHAEKIKNSSVDQDELYTSILSGYLSIFKLLQEYFFVNSSGYNESFLTIGIFTMWLSCFGLIISICIGFRDLDWLLLQFSILSALLFICSIHFICDASLHLVIQFILVIFLCFGCLFEVVMFYYHRWNIDLMSFNFLNLCLIALQIFSLLASSFIEEEHQVWYFYASTNLFCVLIRHVLSVMRFSVKSSPLQYNFKQLLHLLIWGEDSRILFCIFYSFILHSVLRKWNQTGNKFKHLPDISDWINNAHFLIKYSLVLLSIAFLFRHWCKFQYPFIKKVLYFALTVTFIFKCNNDILLKYLTPGEILVFPWAVYISICVILIYFYKRCFEPRYIFLNIFIRDISFISINAWLLLTILIARPHNIPVLALTLLQEHILYWVLQTLDFKPYNLVCIYIIFMNCSFFYIGNSNSLSTIDVNSGYVGLTSYNPAIVGLLILSNTYSTYVLWLLFLFHRLGQKLSNQGLRSIINTMALFARVILYRLFVLSVYCLVMYVMREHLFIITVFAPKLFYEMSHSFVVVTFFIFYLMAIPVIYYQVKIVRNIIIYFYKFCLGENWVLRNRYKRQRKIGPYNAS